jgi:UDP-N-acetylglucosamine diphosphorylase/glucosamine-1-phosphate N-acetyltransferase
MSITKAVILAAGEGKRMHPLTQTRPKVMLPVMNVPLLERLIIQLKTSGVKEFYIVVGYHSEIIRNYFGDGSKWGIFIHYVNQEIQGGTADAVRLLDGLIHELFIVSNGDILVGQKDIDTLLNSSGNSMCTLELANVTGLGVVKVESGFITAIYEKMEIPPSNTANAGVYTFTPEIFNAIRRTPKSPRGEYEITDSIQLLINSGIKIANQSILQWMDCAYPWDLLNANEKLLKDLNSHVEGEVEPNVTLKGAVSIGKGTIVKSGAYIVGPVIIGQNCDIGPNCYIRASTSIGNHCHVGASVEIKNSILFDGAKVPHLNYVGDSIIGTGCNLGAGTKIANLKLDHKNILAGGVDSGRRKLGAILGDNVQTGINASINVGTMIGSGAFIGPGALAHGIVAKNAKVF